jgi:hypothetical protein
MKPGRLTERAHRPRCLHVRGHPQWRELFPHLKELDIDVSVRRELPKVQKAYEDYLRQMREAHRAGMVRTTAEQAAVEQTFPATAKWVREYGHIEIGDQEMFGFVVRALDYSGIIFEDDKTDTLAEAMAALEEGLLRSGFVYKAPIHQAAAHGARRGRFFLADRSISLWSLGLLLSDCSKLPLEILREHLGCVDQCLQGHFVAWVRRERQGRFRHPNGPVATVWPRLEWQGRFQQDLEETGTELLLLSVECHSLYPFYFGFQQARPAGRGTVRRAAAAAFIGSSGQVLPTARAFCTAS